MDLFESTNREIDERFGRVQYLCARDTRLKEVVANEEGVQKARPAQAWTTAPDYSRYRHSDHHALEFVGLVSSPSQPAGQFPARQEFFGSHQGGSPTTLHDGQGHQ